MDRARPFAALLILVACVGARADFPIREARWLVPAQRLEALSTQPAPCVTLPTERAAIASFALGEAAFRTPLLLGGQAARAGLSCASCHPGGRANKAFVFPGLSAAPGTADVTSSIMSHKRGDLIFNPKPIPDLALDPPKVARDVATLRAFIRGQIVEEFDGAEPPAAILDGLTTYVRSMAAPTCRAAKPVPITLDDAADDLRSALDLAQAASARGDQATAALMIMSARASLGHIHERYAGTALAKARAHIIGFDRALQAAQTKLSSGEPIEGAPLAAQAGEMLDAIARAQSKSLYNPARLARALAQ
ncbi:MAG: hypothetical protein ACKVOJ_01400 [Sphingomonadaceae bacterium]